MRTSATVFLFATVAWCLPARAQQEQPGSFPGSVIEQIAPAAAPRGKARPVRVGNAPPFYSPAELQVTAGESVVWQNDPNADTHSIVADDASFASPDIAPGQSWEWKFTEASTVRYRCRIHPWMQGTVRVAAREARLEAMTKPAGSAIRSSRVSGRGTIALLAERDGKPMIMVRGRGGDAWRELRLPDGVPAPEPERWWITADDCLWLDRGSGMILRHADDSKGWEKVSPEGSSTRHVAPLAGGVCWLVATAAAELGRWDARTGRLDRFPLGVAVRGVRAVASGDPESLWLLDSSGSTIVSFNTSKKRATTFAMPRGAGVTAIAADGQTLWYLDVRRSKVGRIRDGWIHEFHLGGGGEPESIASGGGRVFLAYRGGGVGRLDDGGRLIPYGAPNGRGAGALAADASGRVYRLNGADILAFDLD